MKPSSTVLALALILAGGTAHAAGFGPVDNSKSRIGFAYTQMGVAMEGGFRHFLTELSFDPAHPEAAQAAISVALNSIDAGSAEANDEAQGKQWFDTQAHASARFVSSGIRALGGGRYEAMGKLSIKGRTQPVTAPFSFRQEGSNAVFDGGFTIKRLDYAIGEGAWADIGTVANEIRITFHIVAHPTAAK